MQRLLSLLTSTTLLMGVASVPPLQDVQEPKDARPKSARLANKKTLAKMQGAWRLTEFQLVEVDKSGFAQLNLDHVGFCLVSGNYISIEFHFRLSEGGDDRGRSLVTGIHRFEMEQGEDIETTTLIATSTGRDGLPEFEAPGGKRRYQVLVTTDTMTLARDDGHTLHFERVVDDAQRFDIYGRPVREKDEEAEEEGGEVKDEKDGEEKKRDD